MVLIRELQSILILIITLYKAELNSKARSFRGVGSIQKSGSLVIILLHLTRQLVKFNQEFASVHGLLTLGILILSLTNSGCPAYTIGVPLVGAQETRTPFPPFNFCIVVLHSSDTKTNIISRVCLVICNNFYNVLTNS